MKRRVNLCNESSTFFSFHSLALKSLFWGHTMFTYHKKDTPKW